MLVSNYYLMGNMTVPSTWIALIIAFVIAYIVVRKKFDKRFAEKFSDLIFTFIIVWKLSVVLTNFETVIYSPLSIFYFHGGRIGVFLALIAIGVKVLFDILKKRLGFNDLPALFIGMVTVQSMYAVLMIVLNDGISVIEYVSVFIFVAASLYLIFVIKEANVQLVQLVLLFAALHLFTGAFQSAGIFGTAVLATLVLSLFFVGSHFNRRELVE